MARLGTEVAKDIMCLSVYGSTMKGIKDKYTCIVAVFCLASVLYSRNLSYKKKKSPFLTCTYIYTVLIIK